MNTNFRYLIDTLAQLDQLTAQGWHVWYLPRMREFNALYGFDIAAHGARDVRLLHPDRAAGGWQRLCVLFVA